MEATVESFILFNATEKPVYVVINDKPRLLPKAPVPELIGRRERVGEIEVQVLGKKGKAKGAATLQLDGEDSPSAIINDLAQIEGVLYLVEPEILAAFPHRHDFVAPSSYSFMADLFLEGKLNSEGASLSDKDMYKLMPLASVTRYPNAVALEGTPVMELD